MWDLKLREAESQNYKKTARLWDYLHNMFKEINKAPTSEKHLNEMFVRPKLQVGSFKPLKSEPILWKISSFVRFALKKSFITLSCVSVTLIENWKEK